MDIASFRRRLRLGVGVLGVSAVLLVPASASATTQVVHENCTGNLAADLTTNGIQDTTVLTTYSGTYQNLGGPLSCIGVGPDVWINGGWGNFTSRTSSAVPAAWDVPPECWYSAMNHVFFGTTAFVVGGELVYLDTRIEDAADSASFYASGSMSDGRSVVVTGNGSSDGGACPDMWFSLTGEFTVDIAGARIV